MKIGTFFSTKNFKRHSSPENNNISEEVNSKIDEDISENKLMSDNPIQLLQEDTLGRTAFSKKFAQQILSLDTTSGNVVGVLGPWGSGKTSFVNLSRNEFQENGVIILDFNPWMFSGTEQLVESFFIELSAQLKIKPELSNVARELEEYGELLSGMGWIPFIGPWIEGGSASVKNISQFIQRKKGGVGERRFKIEKVLREINKKIIIVLDDIDRLSTSEIRDIFKLVRLTANFPNIIYIVAFDRARVEQALSEQGIPGRDYLEKILQVTIDLPFIPQTVLNTQITSAINQALISIENPGPLNQDIWPDVFMEIISPLVHNMRDVRRFAISIKVTVSALEGNIELSDVLALEAIRLFLPDVFVQLHESIEALTTTSGLSSREQNTSHLKYKIEKLINIDESNSNIIKALIQRLFPAALRHISNNHYGSDWKNDWLRERRVAHEDILRLYLEYFVDENFSSFLYAEKAWGLMNDRVLLDEYLNSLEATKLQDVIAKLEVYEDKFTPQQVIPSTIVLLNILPILPKKQRNIFEIDTQMIVGRVTYRLIRSLKDPILIESTINEIFPEINTLSSKLMLIDQIGFKENVGHKLVTETFANEIEKKWVKEVFTSDVANLINEHELIRVLINAKKGLEEEEGTFIVDANPNLTLAILKSAVGEQVSQTMGSRKTFRLKVLNWDTLIFIYGDENTLRTRITELKSTEPKDVEELMELVDDYINGWKPED